MEIPSGFAVILREYLMLKKLMSATALGVVLTAGAGMTAHGQVVPIPSPGPESPNAGPDCAEPGPFQVVDELGDPRGGLIDDSFECGTGADARAANSTAIGRNAKAFAQSSTAVGDSASALGEGADAVAENSTAVGQNAFVDELAEDSTAIGQNARIESVVDDPNTDEDESTNSENSTAVGGGTLIQGDESTAVG